MKGLCFTTFDMHELVGYFTVNCFLYSMCLFQNLIQFSGLII
jgi:hypothetical protein